MSKEGTGVSRRNFLQMVGAAGGAAAVHETMVAMGLMRHPSAWAGPAKVDPNQGKGKPVLVLGSGVGGLWLAWRLLESGYRVTLVEAQGRLGGRNHTGRQGSKIFEEGAPPQECEFDKGLYINLGPGRIPYHHVRMMNLCKELDVELEVYVHTSNVNLLGTEGMETYDRRRLEFDAQGYISELLAKAINQGALDQELTEGDRDKLKSLLRVFGDLNKRFQYEGTTRAGCCGPPNVRRGCPDPRNRLAPLGLDALLNSEFWNPCRLGLNESNTTCEPTNLSYGFYQVDDLLWQTTSFQPVGGMDRIVYALKDRLEQGGAKIILEAPVRSIEFDKQTGLVQVGIEGKPPVSGEFCASNIPFSMYNKISTPNADPEYRAAISRRTFSNACKVGWQANRRFWELDQQIYGGISWVQHSITQMWYPSYDYFTSNGTLTGAYNYGDTAKKFGELSFDQRLDLAYEGGQALHGEAFTRAVPKELGVSIAWQKVRYQRGCGAQWILAGDDAATRAQKTRDYNRLLDSDLDGRFYALGDQISTLPGWQEGALMSAEHVLQQINARAAGVLLEMLDGLEQAPMSPEVTG